MLSAFSMILFGSQCFLKVSDSNLLGIVVYTEQYTAIPTKTKAIKSTKTWLLENARFPRFCLSFVSCFVRSSQGGRIGKPRALPMHPPRETRGRCAYDSRWYCTELL